MDGWVAGAFIPYCLIMSTSHHLVSSCSSLSPSHILRPYIQHSGQKDYVEMKPGIDVRMQVRCVVRGISMKGGQVQMVERMEG